MTYLQKSTTFSTDLNEGPEAIRDAFNTFFGVTTRAIVQSLAFSRLESTTGAGDLHLKVVYGELDIEGVEYEMRLYQTTTTQTAQAAFNDDFSAGLCRVPLQFLDVTDHERSRNNNDQLLVVMAKTDRGLADGNGLVGHDTAIFIGEPAGNIAAGASGSCALYDGGGLLVANARTVTNVDTNLWLLGERSLVILDRTTGTYIGIPTCCGAAALVTSPTTTYPPLGTPCVTKEVQSITPITPAP